jgi:hypothetical protein
MQYPAIWHSISGVFSLNEIFAAAGQFTAATPPISAS